MKLDETSKKTTALEHPNLQRQKVVPTQKIKKKLAGKLDQGCGLGASEGHISRKRLAPRELLRGDQEDWLSHGAKWKSQVTLRSKFCCVIDTN